MQLTDLTNFSKIQDAVKRISAGAAAFRMSSPADKDDSRIMLEGKLRARGIADSEAFFKNVEAAVKRTGIESPNLYECPPIADITHILIEETLTQLEREEAAGRSVRSVAPAQPKPMPTPATPAPVVQGEDKDPKGVLAAHSQQASAFIKH